MAGNSRAKLGCLVIAVVMALLVTIGLIGRAYLLP